MLVSSLGLPSPCSPGSPANLDSIRSWREIIPRAAGRLAEEQVKLAPSIEASQREILQHLKIFSAPLNASLPSKCLLLLLLLLLIAFLFTPRLRLHLQSLLLFLLTLLVGHTELPLTALYPQTVAASFSFSRCRQTSRTTRAPTARVSPIYLVNNSARSMFTLMLVDSGQYNKLDGFTADI